jgi:hypothetical protein
VRPHSPPSEGFRRILEGDGVGAAGGDRGGLLQRDRADQDLHRISSVKIAAHAAGLQVALAGSLCRAHLAALRRPAPDVVGMCGAICRGQDRAAAIDTRLVKAFVAQARMPGAA